MLFRSRHPSRRKKLRDYPDCKVMVGDAVLTAEYAEKIGADYYSKDAMQAVEAAKDALKDADV